MYYLGDGVPKDFKQAYVWYRLASDQGDASAQKFLDIITASLSKDDLEAAQNIFLTEQGKIKRSKQSD